MTKKQFALIVAVWAAAMFFIFATPARSMEIGLAKSNATCQESEIVHKITEIRLAQLTEMINKSENDNVTMVLKAEAQGVFSLQRKIEIWRIENCRET